jgi:rhamnose transport system permease protein
VSGTSGVDEATPVAAQAAVAQDRAARRRIELLLRFRELGIVLAIAALVFVTALYNPRFVGLQSIRDILLNTAIYAVLAAGQAVVVITRNIDLSVASVLGLSAFAVATTLASNPGTPIVVAFGLGILVGAACGLVNGVLVRFGKVPALVVTLGTLYVFRGIDYLWAGSEQVTADEFPAAFIDLGTARVLGIPLLAIIAVVVVGVTGVWLRSFRSGRELYAMGSNPEAARLAGVPTGRRLLVAFVLSGALAGLAGVLFATRYAVVDATSGSGYELTVVAAVVVGGVAVFGGSGTVYGAALGALLLSVIQSALPVLRVAQFWQQAIAGALILLAIGTDRIVANRMSAALRRRDTHHGD